MSRTLTDLQKRNLIKLNKLIKKESDNFKEELLLIYEKYNTFVSSHIIRSLNRRLPPKLIIEKLKLPNTYDKLLEIFIMKYQKRMLSILYSFSRKNPNFDSKYNYSISQTRVNLLIKALKKSKPVVIRNESLKPLVEMLKKTLQKIVQKELKELNNKFLHQALKEIKTKIKIEAKKQIQQTLDNTNNWTFNKLLLYDYKNNSDII